MHIVELQMSIEELLAFFLPRMGIATLCGVLIGIERELKHKAAGIKTNMLICVGSTLYTSLSILFASMASGSEYGTVGDPGRITAQIVSGIGFLGGGAIIQSRGNIHGLTTAANIWVVAALGVAIGLGSYTTALVLVLLILAILMVSSFVIDRVIVRLKIYDTRIKISAEADSTRRLILSIADHCEVDLMDFELATKSGVTNIRLKYRTIQNRQKQFLLELWGLEGIKEIK